MKNNTYIKIIIAIFAIGAFFGSYEAGAQANATLFTNTTVPAQNTTPTPPPGAVAPAGTAANPGNQPANYLIKNPLSKTTSLSQVILNVVNIVQILLIMASVLYMLYAGLMFVTARGEPAKINKAKAALLWGCVGIALILAAQVIITTLKNTVSGILQ